MQCILTNPSDRVAALADAAPRASRQSSGNAAGWNRQCCGIPLGRKGVASTRTELYGIPAGMWPYWTFAVHVRRASETIIKLVQTQKLACLCKSPWQRKQQQQQLDG